MKQQSFNDLKGNLTEQDIDDIISIVGAYCRIKTIEKLRANLKYSSAAMETCSIMSRLIKEDGTWHYIAGQSYPDEIRTVRNIMLFKI